MAGIPATEAHTPMKLKVPDGTEPPVGLAGYRALDGAEAPSGQPSARRTLSVPDRQRRLITGWYICIFCDATYT